MSTLTLSSSFRRTFLKVGLSRLRVSASLKSDGGYEDISNLNYFFTSSSRWAIAVSRVKGTLGSKKTCLSSTLIMLNNEVSERKQSHRFVYAFAKLVPSSCWWITAPSCSALSQLTWSFPPTDIRPDERECRLASINWFYFLVFTMVQWHLHADYLSLQSCPLNYHCTIYWWSVVETEGPHMTNTFRNTSSSCQTTMLFNGAHQGLFNDKIAPQATPMTIWTSECMKTSYKLFI